MLVRRTPLCGIFCTFLLIGTVKSSAVEGSAGSGQSEQDKALTAIHSQFERELKLVSGVLAQMEIDVRGSIDLLGNPDMERALENAPLTIRYFRKGNERCELDLYNSREERVLSILMDEIANMLWLYFYYDYESGNDHSSRLWPLQVAERHLFPMMSEAYPEAIEFAFEVQNVNNDARGDISSVELTPRPELGPVPEATWRLSFEKIEPDTVIVESATIQMANGMNAVQRYSEHERYEVSGEELHIPILYKEERRSAESALVLESRITYFAIERSLTAEDAAKDTFGEESLASARDGMEVISCAFASDPERKARAIWVPPVLLLIVCILMLGFRQYRK